MIKSVAVNDEKQLYLSRSVSTSSSLSEKFYRRKFFFFLENCFICTCRFALSNTAQNISRRQIFFFFLSSCRKSKTNPVLAYVTMDHHNSVMYTLYFIHIDRIFSRNACGRTKRINKSVVTSGQIQNRNGSL